jgi:hypothetical protein
VKFLNLWSHQMENRRRRNRSHRLWVQTDGGLWLTWDVSDQVAFKMEQVCKIENSDRVPDPDTISPDKTDPFPGSEKNFVP